MSDSKVNETCAPYFHDFDDVWEASFIEKDGDDPTYMMFLRNLKVCGKAYKLDVSIKHGVYNPIKYEAEDEPPAELNRKIPKSRKGTLIRERRNLFLDVDMQSGQENSAYQTENGHRDILTRKRRRFALNNEVNLGPEHSSLVKENIVRRSSRIAHNSSNAQRDDELVSDVNSDLQSGLKHTDFHKEGTSRSSVRKRRLAVDDKLNSSLEKSSLGKENTRKPTSRNVESSLDAQKYSQARKVHQGVDYHHASEQSGMFNPKANIVDKTYRIFLSGLKLVENSVVYEYGNGNQVFYEENERPRSSNVEVELQETFTNPQSMAPRSPSPPPRQSTFLATPLTPPPRAKTTGDDCHIMSNNKKKVTKNSKACPTSYSWFWKAIKEELRKPYKQKEYEDLLKQANARKPITVHRETRRGGYETEILSQMGKSYLDLYPDLNCEIEKARSDPYKVVNLLRGFFFYLKRVPHGVPKPWMDGYCKTIMPAT